jgi:hypothetical protein
MRGRRALVGVALLSLIPDSMSAIARSTTAGPPVRQTQKPIPPAPKPSASTQFKSDPGMTNNAVVVTDGTPAFHFRFAAAGTPSDFPGSGPEEFTLARLRQTESSGREGLVRVLARWN